MAESSLTTEEIIKIVLGVVGILILIYLSVSLVGIFMFKTESEQAKATIEEISEKIEILQEGKTSNQIVQMSRGWAVFSSEKNEICACQAGKWSSTFWKVNWLDDSVCESQKICVKTKEKVIFIVQSHERGDIYGGLPLDKKGFVMIDNLIKELTLLRTSEGIEIWTSDSLMGRNLEKDYSENKNLEEIRSSVANEISRIAVVTKTENPNPEISSLNLKLSSGEVISEGQVVQKSAQRIYLIVAHSCDSITSWVFEKRFLLADKRIPISSYNAFDIKEFEAGKYYVTTECIQNEKAISSVDSENFEIV
jgi:hypothetical protein